MSSDYESTDVFLKNIEARFNGKISYRCFASFYADNSGNIKDHGVFFCKINDTFYFQDFEINKSILGIPVKNNTKYIKFEKSFNINDVVKIRTVKKKSAISFCKGYLDYSALKDSSTMTKIFCETVSEITLNDNSILYFRFMDNRIENMIMQSKSC